MTEQNVSMKVKKNLQNVTESAGETPHSIRGEGMTKQKELTTPSGFDWKEFRDCLKIATSKSENGDYAEAIGMLKIILIDLATFAESTAQDVIDLEKQLKTLQLQYGLLDDRLERHLDKEDDAKQVI